MKYAIVTGAAGFAGSHAVEWFLQETNWDILAIDSYRHKGDHGRLDHLQASVDRGRLRFAKMDLGTPIPSRMIREFRHAHYIINYASDSHIDRSISDPRVVWENNTALILNVLEASRQCNHLEAFFQVSTDEVYGPPAAGFTHPEWSPIVPSNVYSASKAAQEALCVSYWRTWGIPIVITNSMNMIGEKQDHEKFFPKAAGCIMRGEEIPIHGSPGKVGTRCYTHAKNLADAILFLSNLRPPAQFRDGATVPDRWNICGEREVSNLDLAEQIAQEMGKPLKFRWVDFHTARPGHDPRYALDGLKIALTGWRAPISFDEALNRTVAWCLANPDWL